MSRAPSGWHPSVIGLAPGLRMAVAALDTLTVLFHGRRNRLHPGPAMCPSGGGRRCSRAQRNVGCDRRQRPPSCRVKTRLPWAEDSATQAKAPGVQAKTFFVCSSSSRCSGCRLPVTAVLAPYLGNAPTASPLPGAKDGAAWRQAGALTTYCLGVDLTCRTRSEGPPAWCRG